MRRFILVILLLLSGAIGAWAEDAEQPEKPLKVVVEPTAKPSKRVELVIDVSISMYHGGRLKRVMKALSTILEQPLDEFQFTIFTFASHTAQWHGIKDDKNDPKPCPAGWAKLPSATAVKVAQKWLDNQPTGSTEPNDAMIRALAHNRDELTIILITDGEFGGDDDIASFKRVVKDGQAARKSHGLSEAVIIAYGVGSASEEQKHLAEVGKTWRGGFYVDPNTKPAPAPVDMAQIGSMLFCPWGIRRAR